MKVQCSFQNCCYGDPFQARLEPKLIRDKASSSLWVRTTKINDPRELCQTYLVLNDHEPLDSMPPLFGPLILYLGHYDG